MFEKFSEEAIKVIMLAQEEARRLKHRYVGCEHLLIGLIAIDSEVISHKILSSLGLNLTNVREAVEKLHCRGGKASPKEMPFDDDAKLALIRAHTQAVHAQHATIFAEDLLQGLFYLPGASENAAIQVISALAVELQVLRQTAYYMARSERPFVSDRTEISQGEAMELARGFPKVILFAMEEARRTGRDSLGTEMILHGLAGAGGTCARVLEGFGITVEFVRSEVDKILGKGSEFVNIELPFTLRAKRLLMNSREEAFRLGHDTVNARHLLLALTQEQDGVAHQILMAQNVNLEELRNSAMALFEE